MMRQQRNQSRSAGIRGDVKDSKRAFVDSIHWRHERGVSDVHLHLGNFQYASDQKARKLTHACVAVDRARRKPCDYNLKIVTQRVKSEPQNRVFDLEDSPLEDCATQQFVDLVVRSDTDNRKWYRFMRTSRKQHLGVREWMELVAWHKPKAVLVGGRIDILWSQRIRSVVIHDRRLLRRKSIFLTIET